MHTTETTTTTADTASTSDMPPPRVRARRPDTRQLHVRVSPAERRAIEAAATAAGFQSAGRYLVACATERLREADLIAGAVDRIQADMQAAVRAALSTLADRLAADLAALSAAVSDRPSIGQMQKFLDVYLNAAAKAGTVKPTSAKPAATITGSK